MSEIFYQSNNSFLSRWMNWKFYFTDGFNKNKNLRSCLEKFRFLGNSEFIRKCKQFLKFQFTSLSNHFCMKSNFTIIGFKTMIWKCFYYNRYNWQKPNTRQFRNNRRYSSTMFDKTPSKYKIYEISWRNILKTRNENL